MADEESTGGDFQAPTWINDKEVAACMMCEKGFTLTRRRHHCRGCGKVFCDACSKNKMELPACYNTKGPQRVCDSCRVTLMQQDMESNPDNHAPLPDYEAVHDDLMQKLESLMKEPEEGWHKAHGSKGVLVHTRNIHKSNLLCVRTFVSIRAPMERVLTIYDDKKQWKEWQPDMLKCQTLEEVNDHTQINYIHFKLPVVDDRDVLVYSSYIHGTVQDPKDVNSRTLATTSIVHPICPKSKGKIRAHVNMSATVFNKKMEGDEEVTTITTYVHTDPRGLIPPFVVNQTITRAADQIADMRAYMEKIAPTLPGPYFAKSNTPK